MAQNPGDFSNVSVQQIIQILRENPDVAAECKSVVIDRLKETGRTPPGGQLSEPFLVNVVQNDPELKLRLIATIQKHGLLGGQPATGQGTNAAPIVPAQGLQGAAQAPTTQQPPPPQPAVEETQPRPQLRKVPVPYGNLQALQDLYTQVPDDAAELKRFGMDIFRNGTGNAENLPMDLPAGPDYVLGPGDGVEIRIWGSVVQDLPQTVDRTGRVNLGESGTLTVAGLTLSQAGETIRKAASERYKNPKVDIALTRVRTIRVYVVGDVQRPGAYDISSLSTPLNALFAAGGPTENGSLRLVKHYRGKELIRDVDLYDLILNGVRTDVERLQPGDTVLIPPVGAQVTVAGMVRRPAIYELKGEGDLAQAINLAGGLLVSAQLRQINVDRIEAHQRHTMLSLSLPDGGEGDSWKNLLGSFHVQDGDRVTISPILPYSQQTVYLEGHVFRPGKYPFHKGMQASDLIKSSADLLPEPAEHAEVVRLVPPDYRPITIEFQLSELLGGDDPLELQPFDTVRIFGRYEIDVPRVTVNGEVLRPGEYPLAHNMTAAELVRMAGGFKRSAYTDQADVASYVVQNGQKVLTQHHTIAVAKAINGDKNADVVLKPGDIVTIRQLAGWNDIGSSVTLSGEVMYPGTYGIQESEKLSSLLKRAGGFRDTAYPQGAVLERTQVKELAQKSQEELIERIQAQGSEVSFSSAGNAQEQQAMMVQMAAQQKQVITALRNHPPTGRLVIRITGDIPTWENTAADIELRPGDVLTVPKRPHFVIVNGQVYNPSALSYVPGRNAGWYLRQAGGFTELANKKAVFVVRADGSVLGREGGFWHGSVLNARLQPGDSIIVPEKIVGGSSAWKNLLNVAQMTSGLAIAARVATSF